MGKRRRKPRHLRRQAKAAVAENVQRQKEQAIVQVRAKIDNDMKELVIQSSEITAQINLLVLKDLLPCSKSHY